MQYQPNGFHAATLPGNLGVSSDFMEASDHPNNCTCGICKDWWIQVGADEDGEYGPFSDEEIHSEQTPCDEFGGEVGHRINCPHGSAFSTK